MWKWIRNRMKDSYYFYFVDEASKRRSSLDIGNGSDADEVARAYGKPVSVVTSATHSLWVYTKKNVIFKIDGNDRVDGWIVYDVNL